MCLDCKYRFYFFKQLIIIDRFVCGGGRLHKSNRVVSCINIGYYISHGGCVECHLVLNPYVGIGCVRWVRYALIILRVSDPVSLGSNPARVTASLRF